jgi:nitrous oxidase accessory protein NosD
MAVAALGAAFVTAPAAHAEWGMRVVHQGESIQTAVDAAAAGDTVYVLPGTYRGSVQINKRLTLRGAGAGLVMLVPPATGATGPATAAACAAAGHGLCVSGTADRAVSQVRIESLAVEGFRENGITAAATDRMTVRHVLVKDNGAYGISQENSTRAVLSGNSAVDNGQSGVFVANSIDTEGGALESGGTVIADNMLSGNRIGVTVRRVRDLDIAGNEATGNCGGVFVIGDENTPHAGDLDIRRNEITANNKYCAATARLPFIQGTGILLTGVEDARIADNQVKDNVGSSPMSGGVVLYPSSVQAANHRNQVTGNTLSGNGPSDLADRDTAAGSGNTFTGNSCQVSEPAGRC